ncbi:hypothetical protein NPIL_603121 [Nephila pilipes]|uniref:Uncharacterized protein n=1 Tax=Nephila pilipes TaxID=299642 RepID=A0A8X6R2J1_NEPPI|nr:hypothetical protein NPIL_603121 [Nephila pilipes]
MPDLVENANEVTQPPKSAAQLKKEAKKKEKLEKFKQKQEKIQSQNVDKTSVNNLILLDQGTKTTNLYSMILTE